MNSYEKFYREKLYPFQDGVLNTVKKSGTPFYLTGGTALSRCYFGHRFSDDLVFFVNMDQNFNSYIDVIYREFVQDEKNKMIILDYQRIIKSETFAQFFLISPDD